MGRRESLLRLASLALGCATIAGGCGRAAIRPEQTTSAGRLPRPERVVVLDFRVDPDAVSPDAALGKRIESELEGTSSAERREEIAEQVADALAEDLVKGIRGLGLEAERGERSAAYPPGTLVIDGCFLSIDEGNRLKRLVIGFGAGRSSVDTQVAVDMLTRRGRKRLLTFEAEARSMPMPGAAVTMGAGAAAQGATAVAVSGGVGVLKETRSTAEADAGAGASQIVDYLSEFFAREGWIAPELAKSARLTES